MFVDHDIVVANCAGTAKKILDACEFNIVFLDHDLGGKVYVNSEEENTGYQVAKYIPSTNNNKTKVVIHSWNRCGAQRMLDVLSYDEKFIGDVKAIMFETFDKSILYE